MVVNRLNKGKNEEKRQIFPTDESQITHVDAPPGFLFPLLWCRLDSATHFQRRKCGRVYSGKA